MRRCAGLFLVLSVLLLAACSGTSTQTARTAGTAGPSPTLVRIARTSYINTFPPLDVTVRDAAQAQHLYTAIKALPPFVTRVSCPADTDLEYRMTFLHAAVPLALVVINATGCPSVVLGPHDLRGPTPAFWALFAATLNVPASAVFPQPIAPVVRSTQ